MTSDSAIKGGVEITFEYSRHVGPRYIHGALTLQFYPNLQHEFISTASWPTSDNYEKEIREEMKIASDYESNLIRRVTVRPSAG